MTNMIYNRNWIPDAKEQREAVAAEGIGSRPTPSTEEQATPDFYSKMFDAMSVYFDGDKEEARDKMEPSTEVVSSEDAELDSILEELSKASALEHRDMDVKLGNVDARGSTGDLITQSIEARNKKEDTDAETISAATADTDSVSNSKDGQESAPVTAETQGKGLMSPDVTNTFSIVSEALPISESDWDLYREEVARIESSGKYDTVGGANDHYDGRYQLGKMAKADAAQLLGMDLGHSAKEREAFRKDPELQEKAFAAYTAKNHQYLTNKSEKYRNLPTKEKLAVLGYAHNQGWSGANKWLETGEEGKDAFGTKGTKYYDAITSAMEAN